MPKVTPLAVSQVGPIARIVIELVEDIETQLPFGSRQGWSFTGPASRASCATSNYRTGALVARLFAEAATLLAAIKAGRRREPLKASLHQAGH